MSKLPFATNQRIKTIYGDAIIIGVNWRLNKFKIIIEETLQTSFISWSETLAV